MDKSYITSTVGVLADLLSRFVWHLDDSHLTILVSRVTWDLNGRGVGGLGVQYENRVIDERRRPDPTELRDHGGMIGM